MSRWRAVVFDLDDTLYPERSYVLSGFDAVAVWAGRSLGVDAMATRAELHALFAAGIRGDTFDRWLTARGLDRGWTPELVRVYREHAPVIVPFPGVPEMLARLSARIPLGLVSDGYLDVQRAKFDALGFAPYFHTVVFSDALGREHWKPSPAPFRRVLDGLGVDAADAVYVGDNCRKDFIGARAAGLATVWARHSGGEYANLEPATDAHAADVVIADLSALDRLLG